MEPGGSPDYGPEPQSFADMGLSEEVLRALTEMGFQKPMPVQRVVFRPMMAGRDLIVQSRTGSGKTAAFGIPFAQGLIDPTLDCTGGRVQALVLGPTRELALQVATEVGRIAQYRGIQVVPVYGGAPMGRQVEALKAGGQLVSGTPGRVLDHLRRGTLHLSALRVLVLDEADEMLSMGFYEDIVEVIKRCPVDRQTLLFSATMPEDVERLARRHMRDPLRLSLSQDFVGAAEITHAYYMVAGVGRPRDLMRVLEVERPDSAVIFCNTREETGLVAEYLRAQGLDAEAISSDLTQADRERVMGRMKQKRLKYLVATDIAARGIDISDLSHVINYTLPESAEVYIHRTGRTGRAGKSGVAISLVGPRELGNFYFLKLTYKIRPEERLLPSEEELQTLREGQLLDRLRRELREPPGALYRSLLRRALTSDDGERLLAALLERHLAAPAMEQPEPEPRAERVHREHREPRAERVHRSREGREAREPRSDRDRDLRRRRREREEDYAESPQRRRERQERLADRRREEPRPERDERRRGWEGEREPRRRERGEEREARPAPPEAGAEPRPADAEPLGEARVEALPEPTEAPDALDTPEVTEGVAAEAQAGEGADEETDAEERRKRRRRGGRSRKREGAPARSSESGHPVAMPGPDDVIEVEDGREFWEAWVDSRSAAPGEAAAASEAEEEGEGEGGSEAQGDGRRKRRRRRNGESRLQLQPGDLRLYLNLGRRDGLDEAALSALLQQRGLPPFSAELHNTHAYLAVPEGQVDQVVTALSGFVHEGRTVLCERARK